LTECRFVRKNHGVGEKWVYSASNARMRQYVGTPHDCEVHCQIMAEKLHLQPDIDNCRTTRKSDNTEADIGVSDVYSVTVTVTASCMATFLDSELRR